MKSKTIAISQPTFLPWLGWFDLADQSDLFVILDTVSFSKQSWQQRNRIRTQSGLEYLSVPVKTSGRFGQRIKDCEIVNQSYLVKMIKSLYINYNKAPFFDSVSSDFINTMQTAARNNRLAELNIALIFWIAKYLGISTKMVMASTLDAGGQRGEYVASICACMGADRYLSPSGAEEYLLEDRRYFEQRSVEVFIQMYEHPEYVQQFKPFMPFASTLDLIFNVGPNAGAIMRSGRRVSRALVENKQTMAGN